ncbi:serine protease [Streptomyces sp. NPDC050703]|uniref:serine protease n=1 Tax=Streptomyces sp. NPDC050703 TaxID=3157218 RepID=UPI00341B61B6
MSLVRVCDPAGRPRGMGFAADDIGTVITAHEVVDGLAGLVLRAPGERTCVVSADAVVALPDRGLALVRTEGLGLRPLPLAVRDSVAPGTYVRIAACGWREARLLGSSPVTYPARDGVHPLASALELAIGTSGTDALRLGGGAAGGPVVDASSGTVLGVLGTALLPRTPDTSPPGEPPPPHRPAAFAVPLRGAVRPAGVGSVRGAGTVAGPGPGTLPGAGAVAGVGSAVGVGALSAAGPPAGGGSVAGAGPLPGVGPLSGGGSAGGGGALDGGGALGEVVGRNAATVPAYGPDLNLAGALHLTATSAGSDGPRPELLEPVARPGTAAEFDAFTAGPASVLALVGDPGTGRTTELAVLAARRARGAAPLPTLWLRGADLRGTDTSVADAVERALSRAGRILAAARDTPADQGLGDISAGRVARLLRDAGRPLLLLLDGPEEMPPAAAHRPAAWSEGTAAWLRETGARLVVACRAEYWEQAGAHYAPGTLHGTDAGTGLPPRVHLGDLPEPRAREARERYGIPEGALADADARHPLALRLLGEVRAALPDAPPPGTPSREEVLAAYLDLLCLRIAVRLAAPNGLRGTAVRRLAAKVSGQVHEAARRSLGPGHGELDRASFEAVFPWGAAPDPRFHGCTGWASAVLTEGLLVPAGAGYRFAHEELADWLQGTHLDVDVALDALVHRHGRQGPAVPEQRSPASGRPSPVPRHRIGPVVQALLSLGRQRGPAALAPRLRDLADAAARPADATPGGADTDAAWWGRHLLRGVLSRVPDAAPYLPVLEVLADRGEFDTGFWLRLPLGEGERFALLRRLVVRDGPPGTPGRCLDAVAKLLAADPVGAQPRLIRWFADERPLDAAPDATVASAAQALLYTHRHRAVDALTDALVESGHARADELLAALAEEEPAAVCRAVDRWAQDERPGRRAAAAAHGLRAAAHTTAEADRELLRYTALTLLAAPGGESLHGAALALLVRDPATRTRYLTRALRLFSDGDARMPVSAVAAALPSHPEAVLAAFRARLRAPGPVAEDVLGGLLDVTTPALAERVAALVRDLLAARPEAGEAAAAYVDRRLDEGPGVRDVLSPLVLVVLHSPVPSVRATLAPVLAGPGGAAPGGVASRGAAAGDPRGELLDALLGQERDPVVLESVVRSVARAAAARGEEQTRERLLRAARPLVRTPGGASRFGRCLVELARSEPGFAALVTRWFRGAPEEWAALVGPDTRRTIENLAGGVRVPA